MRDKSRSAVLKCKKEISDDLLRCNYCNTKVQSVCPVCGRINVITSEFCNGCGLQLLKYCQECKTVNLPVAKKCRKCGIDFEIDEDAITISDINQDGEKINYENFPQPKKHIYRLKYLFVH